MEKHAWTDQEFHWWDGNYKNEPMEMLEMKITVSGVKNSFNVLIKRMHTSEEVMNNFKIGQ